MDALAAGEGKRLSSLDVIGAGPRAVAGILESFDVDYQIMRIEDYLRRRPSGFEVLLVSAMSMDEPAVKRASNRFKGLKILGGPITSDLSVVRRLGFDLGVWGEGEISLESLMRKGLESGSLPTDIDDVPNLVFPNGRMTKATYLSTEDLNRFRPSSKAVTFYTTLPHYRSARVHVEVVRSCSNYNRPKIWASREICNLCRACFDLDLRRRLVCPQGIPPGCGYCSIPQLYGPPKSRERGSILNEVRELASLGVKRIVLSGADFLEYGREKIVKGPLTHPYIPRPNLEAIEDLLEGVRSVALEFGVFFEVENVKPCLVNEEVASILGKYLRGSPIHIGVETGDPVHADQIGRPCGPEESLRAIKLLKEAGLRPYAYFIHSLPGQTERVVKRTIEAMKRAFNLGAEKITVYRFRPLPGTAFERHKVVVDKGSKEIADTAISLNRSRKEELVGKEILAIVAPYAGRGVYAYPVMGGPVIRLKVRRHLKVGRVVKVKVVGVLSDRLVEGVLTRASS